MSANERGEVPYSYRGPWCATDNLPLADCERHRNCKEVRDLTCEHGVTVMVLCAECQIA
jgi:hypothetical protein